MWTQITLDMPLPIKLTSLLHFLIHGLTRILNRLKLPFRSDILVGVYSLDTLLLCQFLYICIRVGGKIRHAC